MTKYFKKLTISYYRDHQSGWFKVPVSLIRDLRIENKISPKSFIRKGYAYVDDKIDARLLFDVANQESIMLNVRMHFSNKSSKIRSYEPFTKIDLNHNHNHI